MNKNNNKYSNNQEQPNTQNPFPLFQGKEQVRSYKRGMQVSLYDFYIIDEIGEPEKYMDMIHTLSTAEPHDTIFIHLNSRGGDLYTTVQILAAMNSTQAKTVTTLEGQACSAATFIFLAGDMKIVNPNCTFMIHNYSQTTAGKGNEVIQHIGYMNEYFNKLATDIYSHFLTKEELDTVIAGTDLWMHSHEVTERLATYDHEFIYTGEDLSLELEPEVEINSDADVRVGQKAVVKPAKSKNTRKKTSKKKTSKKKTSKKT
jgi:ATP-dependent protease ClpP protease subunit